MGKHSVIITTFIVEFETRLTVKTLYTNFFMLMIERF